MKAKVNLQLLKVTTFDSGALGMLAMVIHQFPIAGRYRVAVMQQGRPLTDTEFVVDESSGTTQLNIDLAQTTRDAITRFDGCDCKGDQQTKQSISPKGYVLFHVSSGGGYSARVLNEEDKLVFDTTKLGESDMFAVSLLEPGNYSMTNRINSSTGAIRVASFTPKTAKRIQTLETRYVDVAKKNFGIKKVEVFSAQGLVFRIKDSAQIFIEKKTSPEKKNNTLSPLIHWQKPQVTKKKTTK